MLKRAAIEFHAFSFRYHMFAYSPDGILISSIECRYIPLYIIYISYVYTITLTCGFVFSFTIPLCIEGIRFYADFTDGIPSNQGINLNVLRSTSKSVLSLWLKMCIRQQNTVWEYSTTSCFWAYITIIIINRQRYGQIVFHRLWSPHSVDLCLKFFHTKALFSRFYVSQ